LKIEHHQKRINVLQFICPTGYYGAERWIIALSNHLNLSLIDNRLVVARETSTQNLTIVNKFQSLGLPAYQLSMQSRFDPAIIKELLKLIRTEEIDIIHTHGYKSDIIGLIAARLSGIRVIATPHGFENAADWKLRLYMKAGIRALKKMDCVAPLSDDLEQELLMHGVASERMKTVLNGVDLSELKNGQHESPTKTEISSTQKIIGYVGQLSARKNVADLIRGFNLLHARLPDCRLILVGDGPQRNELATLAQSLPCRDMIEFAGYRDDRLDIMRTFDIFCMTSTMEGIPRAMMEAMALHTPVVAYNIPGVDKLVIHGITGLMAEMGNVGMIADHLFQILTDVKLHQQMMDAGYRHVVDRFSAERMAREYEHIYEQVLQRKQVM
jgi:glycosyltransferase involved in cell wall biosynthesis